MATKKAEKVAKEFKVIAKELKVANNKIGNCSKEIRINELSKNGIGQAVKECIELKIQENESSSTIASTSEPTTGRLGWYIEMQVIVYIYSCLHWKKNPLIASKMFLCLQTIANDLKRKEN